MSILELFTKACENKSQFSEYTGITHDRFLELLPHFKIQVGKHLTSDQKLFAICYALHHKLSGKGIGDLLFSSNQKRDGENFFNKARSALEEAQSRVTAAAPVNPTTVKLIDDKPRPQVEVKPEQHSYLGLPDMQAECEITHAPLNSSGDIYHIFAYLILCAHFKKKIPNVMLTYDTDGTKNQANRGCNFAKSLSYASFFRTEKIKSNNAFYEVVRQSQLEAHLKDNYPSKAYLDQMATTTIIAQMYLQYGFDTITKILRKGFTNYDSNYFPPDAQQEVEQYVAQNMNQLKINKEQKPVIVLHIRYAKTANEHLNLPDDLVVKLIDFLAQKGYETWCILADDRTKKVPNYPSTYTTRPFKNPILRNEYDYSKFQHLQLMEAIAKNHQIKGVIGNTSGTLDACAFVGNRVYNIHQFNTELSYQDFRLAMQFTFLSAEDLSSDEKNREFRGELVEHRIKAALPNFERWLLQNQQTLPSIRYHGIDIPMTMAGFKKMFHVFMPKTPQKLPEIENFHQLILNTLDREDMESGIGRLGYN